MRIHQGAFTLAAVAAVGTVGQVTEAQASTPQLTPTTVCASRLSSPSPTTGGLAATIGPDGTATVYGQGSTTMTAPLTYTFAFGDDSPTLVQNTPVAQHTYSINARFAPTVTVTDAGGASVTSTCALEVGTVKDAVTRYAGENRYQTSSAVSSAVWADAVGDTTERRQAKAVVLASGEGFADALAGVPLAAYKQGPLLLTEPGGLTKITEDEIKRVLPAGATVYVLGGQAAVSAAVGARLRTDGYQVTRYAGADRYGTALEIAKSGLDNPASTIVVTGNDFADALAAGPVATGDPLSANGKPAAIVLSNGPTITDAATKAFVLARLDRQPGPGPTHVLALGGESVCAVQAIDAESDLPRCSVPRGGLGSSIGGFDTQGGGKYFDGVVGADRYQTADAVSGIAYHTPPSGVQDNLWAFGLASGSTYADALTGGAAMAVEHGPILLTARDYFPSDTATYIHNATTQPAPSTFRTHIFGGPAAIAPALENALVSKIRP